MHGKLAGKQSLIAVTLKADLSLCNVRMSAHDLYQKFLELRMSPLLVMAPRLRSGV